jgi:hypothetical protein
MLINDAARGNLDGGPWEVVKLVRPPTKVFMPCDESMREWLGLCVDRV